MYISVNLRICVCIYAVLRLGVSLYVASGMFVSPAASRFEVFKVTVLCVCSAADKSDDNLCLTDVTEITTTRRLGGERGFRGFLKTAGQSFHCARRFRGFQSLSFRSASSQIRFLAFRNRSA